jgi:Ca2+-transporting ATPase
MHRPPRNPKRLFFGWSQILYSLFKGFLLLTTVFIVYFIARNGIHTNESIRGLIFSSLILGNVALIWSSLSSRPNFNPFLIVKNKFAVVILSLALLILSLILVIPQLGTLFKISNPGLKNLILILAATVAFFICLEGSKLVYRKNKP